MALSALSARQGGATQPVATAGDDDDDDDDDSDEGPRTPKKSPRKKKSPTPLGSAMTPKGRRSTRLQHKED
jgi:hypothetical protein